MLKKIRQPLGLTGSNAPYILVWLSVGIAASVMLILWSVLPPALANYDLQSACLEFEDPSNPESDCLYSHGWGGDDVPFEGECMLSEVVEQELGASTFALGASTFARSGFGQTEEDSICVFEEKRTRVDSQLPSIPEPTQSFLSRDCSTGQRDLDERFAVLYQFWLRYIKSGNPSSYESPDRVEVYAEVCLPPRGLLGDNPTARILDLNGVALVSGRVNGWAGGFGPQEAQVDERYPLQATVNARQLDRTAAPLRAELLRWAQRTAGQPPVVYRNVTARFLTGQAVLPQGAGLGNLSYTNQQGRVVRGLYKVQATQRYPLLK